MLRDSIANTPQPDVEMVRQFAPQNEAEWLAFITERDKENAAKVPALVEQFPASVKNDKIEGVNLHHVILAEVDPRHENHLFVYAHGGAYIFNSGYAEVIEAILIALRAKMQVLSIDYRMPPLHPFPAGL